MNSRWTKLLAAALGLGMAAAAVAQMEGGRPRWRQAAQVGAGPVDRGNVPTWPVAEKFERDLFTFARVRYTSNGRERSSYAWWTDYPDADLNLSFRLQQLTSMKVSPEPKIVELTDPELFDYPWVIMSGAGNIELTDREAERLRTYLLNGGFLMVDDFWGQTEWDGVARAMKKVFPDREPRDVPRNHRVFQSVYKLPEELSLQTCNVRAAVAGRETGKTWEDNHEGGNTQDLHFRALFDDKDRMMVFLCHNTDNGDGWEEEDSDPWFFQTFSEKKNYPLAINILFYAMTH
jgi:hypothetical protein